MFIINLWPWFFLQTWSFVETSPGRTKNIIHYNNGIITASVKMCHINYTLSVTTRITHQPSVCGKKTLRPVAVDAFCWSQGPSSTLITNHTRVLQWRTPKMFSFFSFTSCQTNCLCCCVVDLLRCPALLPPLLTKHINYVDMGRLCLMLIVAQ